MNPRPRDLRHLACALLDLAGDLEAGHRLSYWHAERVARAMGELLMVLMGTPTPPRRRREDRRRRTRNRGR